MHVELPPDVCVLVADHGIGDHYLVGAFAAAIARQHRVRPWLAGRGALSFLADLFPGVERYLAWPVEAAPGSIRTPDIRGGTLFHAHFPGLELMRAVGYNGFHFLDAYRCRFGLPPAATLERPRPPGPDDLARAVATLQAHGLPPGRSVLLGLEARSTPMDGVDDAFWSRLVAALRAAGWHPFANGGPATRAPAGLPVVASPVEHLRGLALAAGAVCTVRSGLSDLLSDLPCPRVVVYPHVRYWAGTLQGGTGFARFGLARPPHEVLVTPATAAARAAEIAARLGPLRAAA